MTNGTSGQAIQDAANSISQMRNDISAMVTDIRNMNSALSVTASKSQNAFQAGGTGGSWGVDAGRIAADWASGGMGAGMVTAVKEVGKSVFTAVKDVALSSYNDLRIGREDALQFERQRLIARGGTGEFSRFQDNLNIAMNDINVQDKWAVTKDLANAYSSYYAQAMGGGVGGEQRTAMSIGAMHTLASVAGISAEAVGGATGAMYSSQAYYKAMAAGVQTRNPVTGDMLSPEEIVNQYRKRLAGNTPEEIKRALGPGGTLRAELMQTWGDPALVEMVSKGLVMSSELGAPLKVGDLQTAALTAGGAGKAYAGTEWTQGRDTDSLKQGHEMNRVAEYTNDITAGIATSNVILADINAKIADLGGPMRDFVAATETFGGIMDQFLTDMPQTTMLIWEQIKDALSNLVSGATGNPLDFLTGLSSIGIILGGGMLAKIIAGGAAQEEPEKSGEYPSTTVSPGTLMYNPETGAVPPTEGDANAAAGPIIEALGEGKSIVAAQTINHTANTVAINLTIAKATDAEATRFANQLKALLADDEELIKAGEGTF